MPGMGERGKNIIGEQTSPSIPSPHRLFRAAEAPCSSPGQVPPPALPAPMGPIHPPPRYGGPGGIGGWQGFFWGFLWGFLRVRKEVGGRFLWSPRDLRVFLAGC